MTSVLILVHPGRAEASELAETAREFFTKRGHAVTVWSEEDAELPPADFAISLGGDGTMLRTVQLTIGRSIPVLGVNLGRMGYLAEVEPAALEDALERLEDGDYDVAERMALEVELRRGRRRRPGAPDERYLALNEAIVEKKAPGHTIRVRVAIAGRPFLTYVADGLLVCTPTGSTAYNLSARGPVVSPELDAMVLTPVAPHHVFDRSLVLGPTEDVELTLLEERGATLVMDGARSVQLSVGDSVLCRGAARTARLVTFGEAQFHAVLRSRFSLTDR